MSLGFARDSMLNLAEMAEQKANEEGDSSGTPSISFEDGGEDLVMKLATKEIVDAPVGGGVEDAKNTTNNSINGTFPAETSVDNDSQFVMSQEVVDGSTSVGAEDQESASEVFHTPDSSIHDPRELEEDNSTAGAPATIESSASKDSGAGSYGQYSGFSNEDYHHYDDPSAYVTYEGTPVILGGKKEKRGFLCCIFPWMNPEEEEASWMGSNSERAPGSESMVKVEDTGNNLSRANSKEDDEVSTGSDIFGERLSDKDRQAVLARLRLAQPDSNVQNPSTSNNDGVSAPAENKGLLKGISVQDPNGSKRVKSILKRCSTLGSRQELDKMTGASNASTDGAQRRRSLFPQYGTTKKEKKNLKVEFSPMARVLTVKSQKDMEDDEKRDIWWQRSDYEEFRKTGRMITKAMLEGGSEIWLATNQSWQTKDKDKNATLKNALSLSERQAAFQKGDLNAKREYEETRDKWWHKFGHSRRGLEHIASIDEGRQRQNTVRLAIRAVIDEVRRQKLLRREDSAKIRMVSIQHTAWARDLALAAGASDADAVTKNFDEGSRKSREFYLLKFSRNGQQSQKSADKANMPAFMKPALSLPMVGPNPLDVNTMSQIRYRQSQTSKNKTQQTKAKEAGSPAAPSSKTMPLKEDDGQPINKSMAKQAAGFAKGEEVANMSAVLSGMGPLPKASAAVGVS